MLRERPARVKPFGPRGAADFHACREAVDQDAGTTLRASSTADSGAEPSALLLMMTIPSRPACVATASMPAMRRRVSGSGSTSRS